MTAPAFRIGDVVRLEGMPDAPQCCGTIVGTGWQACAHDHVTMHKADLQPLLLVRLEDGAYLEGRERHGPAWPHISVIVADPTSLRLADVHEWERRCALARKRAEP